MSYDSKIAGMQNHFHNMFGRNLMEAYVTHKIVDSRIA